MVAVAVPAPRTLRKSLRFTVMRLVVACRAIVPGAERWIRFPDVAAHAPAHPQRLRLGDLLHVLDRAVARLAGYARADVPHVGKFHVLGQLVNAHPRDRLLPV